MRTIQIRKSQIPLIGQSNSITIANQDFNRTKRKGKKVLISYFLLSLQLDYENRINT